MWDPSFLIGDWTHDPWGGSTRVSTTGLPGKSHDFLFLMRVCSRQAVVTSLWKKPRDGYLNRGFSVNPDLLETFLSGQPSSELRIRCFQMSFDFAPRTNNRAHSRHRLNTPQASFLIIIALVWKVPKHCNIEKFTKHNAIAKSLK